MNRCIRCKRPLKVPSESGLGPVCANYVAPVPAHEPDLFGFDIEKAVHAARYRLSVAIAKAAVDAEMEIRESFRALRVQLGLWA